MIRKIAKTKMIMKKSKKDQDNLNGNHNDNYDDLDGYNQNDNMITQMATTVILQWLHRW